MTEAIDIAFDFTTDTPGWPQRGDPDKSSPTLRRYHQLLWSKPLPNGSPFTLDTATPRTYLHHRSELGEFWLSSDGAVPCFRWHLEKLGLFDKVPPGDFESFYHLGYTIGGMMIWPGNSIERQWTINQARGCLRPIGDRFDLTVECIRRYYLGEPSPLGPTLSRYPEFFSLFRDFRGFVEFFLLQDIVDDAHSAVTFFMPFDGFTSSPLPMTVDGYLDYRQRAMTFLDARNHRIHELMNDSRHISESICG